MCSSDLSHPRVTSTIHPFLESHPQNTLARAQMRMGGTLLALEIDGGTQACRDVISRLRLARPATSFGGPETLVCHPLSSTHAGLSPDDLAAMKVTEGLLRVSVGLENADDLLADFTSALAGG